jgi:hypothetical protein
MMCVSQLSENHFDIKRKRVFFGVAAGNPDRIVKQLDELESGTRRRSTI